MAGLSADGGIRAKEPPQRDAFARVARIQTLARAQHERMADGDVDDANVADFVGDSAQTAAHLLKKRPVAVVVHVLKLLHLGKKFVQAEETDAGRTAREWKRILLELADEVNETKPGGIQLYLAGLVAGPGTRFFG